MLRRLLCGLFGHSYDEDSAYKITSPYGRSVYAFICMDCKTARASADARREYLEAENSYCDSCGCADAELVNADSQTPEMRCPWCQKSWPADERAIAEADA